MPFRSVFLVLLSAAALAGAEPERPRLAVIISLDQVRADYLERYEPYFGEGGFRLLLGGLNFTDCHYRHSLTKTGPGHATMLSGVHANIHGIIANDWDRREWPGLEQVNCVEDRDAPLVGAAAHAWRSPGGVLEAKAGRSPRHFLATTVGDQLKLRHGARAKVFGVADKDRAAILMTGPLADGAYWTEEGRVVTSTYYRKELPGYWAAFNAEQRVEKCFGRVWDRLLDASVYEKVQGPDDVAGESVEAGLGRTFPKRIDGGQPVITRSFYEAFDHAPWNNDLVADMARAVVVNEHLGEDDGAPDLLAIGFSQIDKVGHTYGPDSHESMDAMLRLDRTLAELLRFIDEKIGLKHCTIVLTADHGVAPLPERIQAAGGQLAAGRIRETELDRRVFAALDARFGALAGGQRWAARDGMAYHLNPAVLAEMQLEAPEVEAAVRDALLAHPAVAAAYTRAQLTGPAPLDWIGEAMRLSYHPPRSGDVVWVLKPYFIDRTGGGSTHGTPYDYDNHVPLVWFGTGVPTGRRLERVGVDDLAPTLAGLLGVPRPPLALGRQLF